MKEETAMEEKLVKRSQKVAFYGVKGTGETVYHRMTGFTEFSKTSNPKEYNRQYVDEEFERSDIVGYSPEYSYAFDAFSGNAVHTDIAAISDEEKTGTDAVREIIIVDLTQAGDSGKYEAVKREFSVIPDSEGDSTDAYTYSGTMKAYGERVSGSASSADDFQTVTFTEAE